MTRAVSLLLGPELYWVIIYTAVSWMAAKNLPPTPQGNEALERLWWILPLIAVPLTFVLLRVPVWGSGWLLFRIDIAALVGLIACTLRSSEAINYNDSRNSGTGAGFILALSFGLVILTA